MAQPGPNLAMAFAMERAGGENGANGRCQRLIGHRPNRPAPPWLGGWRWRPMAIDARAGEAPDTTDHGQPIRFAAHRRDGPAHRLGLPRAKGRLVSSRAIFSFSRSRSISAAPSLAFSRSLSSSSPQTG